MLRKGPIVIIEDDPDDQEILKEVFDEPQVMNQLKFFKKLSGQPDFFENYSGTALPYCFGREFAGNERNRNA